MSQHANRVQMTLSSGAGNPGTGPLTLGTATAGYRSFSVAYGADVTVDILITEGTSWEVCRNCSYTQSTTTVTRGTLESSSSGGAISFTSAAIVGVIATAATGNNWGLNEVQSSANAAVTGVVGTMHILDISGFTVDRDFTLPVTCAVGDRVGVFIKTGDPSFELLLKPASGDTINGGSPGAEWSRLFISNECVIFRCIAANSEWIVEYDGRIPCQMSFDLSTAESGTKNVNTYYAPTSLSGVWTVVRNLGDCGDSSTSRFNVRRTGSYVFTGSWGTTGTVTDGGNMASRFFDGAVQYGGLLLIQGAAGAQQQANAHADYLSAGAYIEFQTRASVANMYCSTSTTWFSAMEVL